jgi:hypothetical protein
MPSHQCGQCPSTGHQDVVDTRWLRPLLPRRLRAYVRSPEEIQMGSPQYGRLILDGRAISRLLSIEARSFLWSDDGTRLAAQELVSSREPFSTRVVVFDTRERSTIASSYRGQVSRTLSGSSETSSCIGTGTTRQGNMSCD